MHNIFQYFSVPSAKLQIPELALRFLFNVVAPKSILPVASTTVSPHEPTVKAKWVTEQALCFLASVPEFLPSSPHKKPSPALITHNQFYFSLIKSSHVLYETSAFLAWLSQSFELL